MKNLLLSFLFISVPLITSGQSNSGPVSIFDLERILTYNESELEIYVNNYGFENFKKDIGRDVYNKSTGDEQLFFLLDFDVILQNRVKFYTSSKDRYLKIKNSLNERYSYSSTTHEVEIYLKKGEPKENFTVVTVSTKESKEPQILVYVFELSTHKLKEMRQSVIETSGETISNKLEVYSGPSQANIFVKEGSTISISTTGNVRFGAFAGTGNANGIDGFTMYNKVNGFRHGALLGQINNGPWFIVGTNASYKITTDGVLKLMINDNSPDDNEGRFLVNYSIKTTSNGETKNISDDDGYKFVIRNPSNTKLPFQLSADEVDWAPYSLEGLTRSDYWFPGQQRGFFRIKTSNGKSKVYKVEAGKKYYLEWNSTEECWDLYSDGDR